MFRTEPKNSEIINGFQRLASKSFSPRMQINLNEKADKAAPELIVSNFSVGRLLFDGGRLPISR
jgi:hypothetical protein